MRHASATALGATRARDHADTSGGAATATGQPDLGWSPAGPAAPLTKEQFAYSALRAAILSERIAPGTALVIRDIASRLQLSPIPVRAGLQRLAAEGLIHLRPHVGYKVNDLPMDRLIEVLEVREPLEAMAARLAAARSAPAETGATGLYGRLDAARHAQRWSRFAQLNRQFHEAINASSGNQTLADTLHHLYDLSERTSIRLASDAAGAERAQREHAAILDAVSTGNPDAAAARAAAHRRATIDVLIARYRP